MGRAKVAEDDKRKRKSLSISDNEWEQFSEAAEQAGHKTSVLLRAIMEDFIAGRYTPFPRPHKQ